MLVRRNWTIGLVAAVAVVALSACLPPPKGWVVTAVTGQDEARACSSSGDGGPVGDAYMKNPLGLEFDAEGNLYVAEGGRVRIVTTDGIIGTLVGGGDSIDPGGSPTDYRVQFAYGVAVDTSGGVFFTNAYRCSVLTMEQTGGSIGGQVLDSAGSAVAGATVELYDAADPTTPIDARTTGSGGIYGFSLPPGQYKLRVTVLDAGGDPVVETWHAGAADGASATTITIAPHDQPRVDVTLDDLTLG